MFGGGEPGLREEAMREYCDERRCHVAFVYLSRGVSLKQTTLKMCRLKESFVQRTLSSQEEMLIYRDTRNGFSTIFGNMFLGTGILM